MFQLFCLVSHILLILYLEMVGTTLYENVSSNTYYNTTDSCFVSWSVIEVSILMAGNIHFVFLTVTLLVNQAVRIILCLTKIYLGCHFYPNQIAGLGTIKLEIITNGIYIDTVSWIGIINPLTSINENTLFKNIKIKKIYDLYGKSYNSSSTNQLFLYLRDDGKVEKRIVIE